MKDGGHEGDVDVPMSDVRPLRVVGAFLVVWAWTAGVWILFTSGGGIGAVVVVAVATLAYLALFGIPVACAMYKMQKRSLPAYFLAALVVALPMASLSLYPLGSPFLACLAMATAAVGALVGYGIVERG
ncbi:MAG: hypothetical protein OXU77_01985 [Gammaproteobacteria bacterium]|nr:hypothetical protein [Gammaproteobacteria bacterium]MDE0443180.1 hypothetical protein [Gammaproteobacteria bacterium]